MSKKSEEELGSLAKALVTRFKTSISMGSSDPLLAAGTTRLGQIEFIRSPIWAKNCEMPYRHVIESLLIRIRQARYSSAGIMESRFHYDESKIRIHLESQSGYAKTIQIPYRAKRPRFITLGTTVQKEVSPRWFGDPCDRRLRSALGL